MSEETVVEAAGLSKSFNGRAALDGVGFSVGRGEVVGLLGPNGAGKTTLIHILLGLVRPSAGSVRVLGLEMPRRRQEILARVNFSSAYVSMPLSLTPLQNLEVFARLYGVPRPRARARELLARMRLEELCERPTRALSSGQMSRLSLAKALLNDPEVLFLDEPTASMDPDKAEQTRDLLREVHREKRMTILYTSHNMREVEAMASRVLFLHRGKLAAEGSPKELAAHFHEADLESVFLKIARQEPS